jgi:hypothetical protein
MAEETLPVLAGLELGAHLPWGECVIGTGTGGGMPLCPPGISSATTAIAPIALARSGANAPA